MKEAYQRLLSIEAEAADLAGKLKAGELDPAMFEQSIAALGQETATIKALLPKPPGHRLAIAAKAFLDVYLDYNPER